MGRVQLFKSFNSSPLVNSMQFVKLSRSSSQKTKELIEGSAKQFKVKMGLCDHGLNIKKELIDSHASIVECEAVFGNRKDNNGFRYEQLC